MTITIQHKKQQFGVEFNDAEQPFIYAIAPIGLAGPRYLRIERVLRSLGLVRSERPGHTGFFFITCPWNASHQAAYKAPYVDGPIVSTGDFTCTHHGCRHRKIEDLADWVHGVIYPEQSAKS